jgi:ABC-type Fe3+ transport system permease subunit
MKIRSVLSSLLREKRGGDPVAPGAHRPMRLRHFGPLIAFAVPSLVIGYGVVIPGSCIAGVNQLTLGFASTIVGACITYLIGVRSALRGGEG